MKKYVILVLFVVWANVIFATNYYVGGAGASDSNPGTSAQPFATIQKAASVAVAGDIVNIRSGTYRETIVPAHSGTPGNPIIFQPDGGAAVTISGLNTAEGGWSVHNGNIYKKSITLPVNGYNSITTNNTTLLANQIFKDGVMMFEARWPKLNTLEDMMDRTKVRDMPSSTSNSITDSGIPSIPGGWVGATVWVNGWYITMTGTVTNHSGSTITFSPGQGDPLKRERYYLTGKLGALTQAKEWHYESGTLYFWQPGGGSPTGVEYKARNYGFDLTNRSSITIQGLSFMGCTPMHGNTASTNITIDNIRAKYLNHAVKQALSDVIYGNPKQTGIKLIGANSIIKNSELQYAASQAIWLGENCTAHNNLIRDISYEGNYGAGVTLWENTANQTITNNTFASLGRSAVDFGYVDHGSHFNVEIAYNDMYDFGNHNLDMGAVYAGRHGNTTGWNVHHNWIHDSGVAAHTTGINTGLYYDQGSGPSLNHHNVLWNNIQTDYFAQPNYTDRNGGVSYLYNNVFATVSSLPNSHSYKCPSWPNPVDIQRNNIYRQDVLVALGSGTPNLGSVLSQGTDPQFVGTGTGGLAFRLRSTSPAINKGVVIPGITDGSVGAPDIGAYENGGTDWIPGYKAVATAPNTPPVVTVTSPANSASFPQGTPITFSATASDANGTVTRIEFFCGTTKVGEDLTSPYSFVWNNAPTGTNVLTARATDNANSVTTSSPVTITVNTNATPTVTITGPANNSQFVTGSAINIAASAADANGSVTKVEFFSGTTKVGEDVTSPYTFVWNNPTTGTHSLMAKAIDNMNSVSSSAIVTVLVMPNPPPTVVITAPANNAQFTAGTAITIAANASDANGTVSKVEFFHGTTKLGEDTSSPYSFAWNNAPVGTYSLSAKATDNQAAVASSATVSIKVVAANTAPVVSITSPASNSSFAIGTSITITASASDANGSIAKIEFYRGNTKLGEDATSPYSFVWANAPVGNYSLIAKAIDNQGVVTTSSPVPCSVVANPPPVVTLTAPLNNSTYNVGSSVTISATASDANGTVSKVEFYNGTTKLGEDLTSPYSYTWNNVAAGDYSITAKATDNQNSVSTSSPVNIDVNAIVPPTISAGADTLITLPNNTLALTGIASATDGSDISYQWAQVSGPSQTTLSSSSSPEVTITNLTEGVYVFELTVTGGNGLSSTDEIMITVVGATQDLQSAIPRFFSPNDDGKGDFWEWSQIEHFENSLLTVFNRSGQKIYEAVSYKNTWDGKVGNAPLQAGDYYYIVQLVNNTLIRGALQIVR